MAKRKSKSRSKKSKKGRKSKGSFKGKSLKTRSNGLSDLKKLGADLKRIFKGSPKKVLIGGELATIDEFGLPVFPKKKSL